MKVLIACEYSGTVRDAFTAIGHDAISCDLLPTETPGKHYEGDVTDIIMSQNWDIVIAHPPCTLLCNSGVRWLYNSDGTKNEDRWNEMIKSANFFKWFLGLPFRIAVENPIMHGYAIEIIGRKATQFIQPWQYGHGETKTTGLWLKGLPSLRPSNIVDGRLQRIWKMPPGPERSKERSRTFQGIAEAMAAQWGAYVESDLF